MVGVGRCCLHHSRDKNLWLWFLSRFQILPAQMSTLIYLSTSLLKLIHHDHGFISLCSAQTAKVLPNSRISKFVGLFQQGKSHHQNPTIPFAAFPRHSSLDGGLHSVICPGHLHAQLCFPILFVLDFLAGRADDFQGEAENHRYHL